MSTSDPISATWRTSSYTSGNGACVEIAELPDMTAVRDTKDRQGAMLIFSPLAWSRFVGEVKAARFDH
jgi:hypothetical protein